MNPENRELPIAECFRDYTVIEYLALLYPRLPRRGLQPLFAAGRVRGGKLPVSPRARLGEVEGLFVVGGVEAVRPMDLGFAFSMRMTGSSRSKRTQVFR